MLVKAATGHYMSSQICNLMDDKETWKFATTEQLRWNNWLAIYQEISETR